MKSSGFVQEFLFVNYLSLKPAIILGSDTVMLFGTTSDLSLPCNLPTSLCVPTISLSLLYCGVTFFSLAGGCGCDAAANESVRVWSFSDIGVAFLGDQIH